LEADSEMKQGDHTSKQELNEITRENVDGYDLKLGDYTGTVAQVQTSNLPSILILY